jgi:hypothetical protein
MKFTLSLSLWLFVFVIIFFNRGISCEKVAGDDNSFFQILAILLETDSYYFVFRYLSADAEIRLCCAECNY